MYCSYQDQRALEDDLYREDDQEDSEGSEADSELQFRLYSQLHYSSNAGGLGDDTGEGVREDGGGQEDAGGKSPGVNGEQGPAGDDSDWPPPSPSMSDLLRHLKKKKKKEKEKNRAKKSTGGPKGQRSSTTSTAFEEVIVIASSPDVISISEEDTGDDEDDDDGKDEDEGICALKGGNSKRLQSSTPATQKKKKKGPGVSVSVTVDSSSSSSSSSGGSEESQSGSDSDSDSDSGLENWMILGTARQDGDTSIKLNLAGGSDSNSDVEGGEERVWLVSDKDKEARICNRDKGSRAVGSRLSNRYYTSKNVQCRNCNKNGHLSKNCPEPKKTSCFLCGTPGHMSGDCPNKLCKNCGVPGHVFDQCSERKYWHKQCHRCGMKGHFFSDCPEIWRQYHVTIKTGVPKEPRGESQGRRPAYCYNCSRKGHYGHGCMRPRMFNGTFASTPFINKYDSLRDIRHRQHTTQLKVQELKKNGLYLAGPQSPHTPGPPTKRQKVHREPGHTPRQGPQGPHGPKPNPNHIFFKDDHDFTPKAGSKSSKSQRRQGPGNVKPWKPKRPVPAARETPTKLKFDEADPFPRGGGKGGNLQTKKKKMMNKTKRLPPVSPGGHGSGGRDRSATGGDTPGSTLKQDAGQKRKRKTMSLAKRIRKKAKAQMYPTDENLFCIKQRKQKR